MSDTEKIDLATEKFGQLRGIGSSMIAGCETLCEDDVSWLGHLISELAETGRLLLTGPIDVPAE